MARVVRYYASVPSGSPAWFTSAGWYLKIDTETPSRLARNDTRLAGNETIIFNADTPALGEFSALAGTDTYQFQLGFAQDIIINDTLAHNGEKNLIQFWAGFKVAKVAKIIGPDNSAYIEITISDSDDTDLSDNKTITIKVLPVTKFQVGTTTYTADAFATTYAAGFTASAISTAPVLADITPVNDEASPTNVAPTIAHQVLAFNDDATEIILDTTHILATDPDDTQANITFTLKSLPATAAGKIQIKSGGTWADAAVNDTFTGADLAAGNIKFVVGDTGGDTSFTFTIKDDSAGSESTTLTFTIDARDKHPITGPDNGNTIDLSTETTGKTVDTGDGIDTIKGGQGNDQITGGLGDDEIDLGAEGGSDEIVYGLGTGTNWTATDGGDTVKNFKRGEDKLRLKVSASETTYTTLEKFLLGADGADNTPLTADDQFIVTPDWVLDSGAFYVTGITFHFREAGTYGNHKIASALFHIDFAARMTWADFVTTIGGATNFDGGRGAIKKLVEVDPNDATKVTKNYIAELLGQDSIDFSKSAIVSGSIIGTIGGTIGQTLSEDLVKTGRFDTSGDTLTYSIVKASDNSAVNWLSIDAGGVLSFATGNNAPDTSYLGSHSLKLKVDDGNGAIVYSTAFTLELGKTIWSQNASANPFTGFDANARSTPSFVDLDGDGDMDLVSGEQYGSFKVWRKDGNSYTQLTGNTGNNANPLHGFSTLDNSAPTFVDIDGDGDMDLVSGRFKGFFKVWRKDATSYTALNGSDNPLNGLSVGTNAYSTATFVDLDGDGDMDLVSGGKNGTFKVWRNDTTGSGNSISYSYTQLTGSDNPFNGFDAGDYSTPAFVDIDGDGDMDLVSGLKNGPFKVWRKDATGYTALTGSDNPFNGFDVEAGDSAPTFVDLDGDGDMDLVSGKHNGQFDIWFKLAGGGYSATNDAFVGTIYNDVINGSGTANTLIGGTGDDTLIGKAGKDAFAGGAGNDVFDISDKVASSANADVITDFTSGDKLKVASAVTQVWVGHANNNTLIYDSAAKTNIYAVLYGSHNLTASDIFGSVAVTALSSAPIITSTAPTKIEDNVANDTQIYAITATDADNDTLSYAVSGTNASYFDFGTGNDKNKLMFNSASPKTGADDTYAITIIVSDGNGASVMQDLRLAVNKAPAVSTAIVDQTGTQGTAFSYTIIKTGFSDADNDTLTYSFAVKTGSTLPTGLSLNTTTGVVSGTPSATGTATIVVTASDGTRSITDEFDIIIRASNKPPAVSGSISGAIGGTIGQTLSEDLVKAGRFVTSDPNAADILSYSIVKASDNSAVNWLQVDSGGVLSFATGGNAPDDTKSGSHSLKLKVSDNHDAFVYSSAFTLELGKTIVTASASTNPFDGLTAVQFSTPTFVDLNGDGDLDLVSGNWNGKFKSWFKDATGYTKPVSANNPFKGMDTGNRSAPTFVDLDGDGDLDLVSGENGNTLKVWRKTTNGYTALTGNTGNNANPFHGFSVGYQSTPSFVDLDGDGDMDLVSGEVGGTFKVWRKDAGGYTALTGNTGDNANPFHGFDVGNSNTDNSAPTFADIDGDGDMDLVSGNFDGQFKVWRKDATGYTALTGNTGNNANPFYGFDVGDYSRPAFADIDGDGDLDLVSGSVSGTFNIWFKLADGSYGTTNDIFVGTIYNDVMNGTSAANTLIGGTGDDVLNGGAGNDALVGSAGKDTFTGGAGDDIFNISDKTATTDMATKADVIKDFTSGDKLKFSSSVTQVWFARVNSENTVIYDSAAKTNVYAVLEGYTTNLTSSDIEGAVTVTFLNDTPIISGSISGTIKNTIQQSLSEDLVKTGRFVTSDSDGDTLTYSIVKASDNSAVNWLVVDSGGVLSFATDGNTPTNSKSGSHSLKLKVDDGNGAIVYSTAFTLELGKAIKSQNASANPFTGFDANARSTPSFVDLDGDGDLDLVSGEQYGSFKVWRKDGNSYTQLTGNTGNNANPLHGFSTLDNSAPTFVDIDGDGDMDLVSGRFKGFFKVWRKDATGYTALNGSDNPLNGLSVGTNARSTPTFVDLDGDGDLDLVSGNKNGTFKVWRNDTTGSGNSISYSYTQLTGSDNPFNGFDAGDYSAPAFVDIDGDGDMDLVSGNEVGPLKVWRKDATGYTALTGSDNPFNGFDVEGGDSAPTFVDLDGDGDMDLVSGKHNGQFDIWFKLAGGGYGATNDAFVGTIYNDVINGSGTANTLIGGAGDDTLIGKAGNDVLVGNAGADILTGGAGDDIFVLDIATTETKDAVTDFSTGNDKIRVDTTNGNEATLAALRSAANLRWTNNTNEATGSSNDAGTNDTVIYNTKGTADTTDDVIIMVIEDYTTALTISDFDII